MQKHIRLDSSLLALHLSTITFFSKINSSEDIDETFNYFYLVQEIYLDKYYYPNCNSPLSRRQKIYHSIGLLFVMANGNANSVLEIMTFFN